MIQSFNGKTPKISNSAYVAKTAVIIGDVEIADNASIWDGAVLRGDEGPIRVGAGSNVQDNCTVHCDAEAPVLIGKNVTVGHNAVIHGCTIGDNCLIGMAAVILNHAVIGEGSMVAAGALVAGNKQVPENTLMMGSPAVMKRELSEQERAAITKNAKNYQELAFKYMQ